MLVTDDQSFVLSLEISVQPGTGDVLVHFDTKECVSEVSEKKPVDADNKSLEFPGYQLLQASMESSEEDQKKASIFVSS